MEFCACLLFPFARLFYDDCGLLFLKLPPCCICCCSCLNLHSTSSFFIISHDTTGPFFLITPISSKLTSNLYFFNELTSIDIVCQGYEGLMDSLSLWLSRIEPQLLLLQMFNVMIYYSGWRALSLHMRVSYYQSVGDKCLSYVYRGVCILTLTHAFTLPVIFTSSHSISTLSNIFIKKFYCFFK